MSLVPHKCPQDPSQPPKWGYHIHQSNENMEFFINENMNESGYNSNGNVGLTRNTPGMKEDINVDKDEVVVWVSEPNEVKNNVTKNIGLTDDKIDKMKVSELKEALEARFLAKNGMKAVLISRLKKHTVANGMDIIENVDPNIVSNMA